MSKPPKNYRWWQDHGQGWAEEVALRKAHMPIYHLQEIFLEEYLSKAAPAKVLDFGCGFGRHLEYLRRVPKLDLYGFDQSESMVGAMSWATPAWRKKRISIGKPLNKLPYADDTFDVVFTVSVLIHVRPRDLDHVISELLRVSRGQVIHIENNETHETFETSAAHDGCWAHDLRTAYQRVAPKATFEVAHSMFEIEDVYRVSKSEEVLPEMISTARAARFLALDQSLSSEIRSLRDSSSHAARRAEKLEHDREGLRQRLEEALTRARNAEQGIEETRQRARAAEARFDDTRTRLATLQERVASLQKNAASADSRMSELKPLADEVRERARKAEETLESLRVRARQAETRCEKLLARAQGSEARVAEVLARVTGTAEALAKQQARFAASQLEVKALGERARNAEHKAAALFERARSAENRLADRREHAERLTAKLVDAASVRSVMEAELRSLRDREESATARVAELLVRLEVEVVRADRLDAAVMLAQSAQERITERERDAQSRLIALRHGSERAEAKAESQRLRARAAESELLRLEAEAVQLRREQAFERERADVALGRIDDAHRAQEQVETELEALRGELTGILGR